MMIINLHLYNSEYHHNGKQNHFNRNMDVMILFKISYARETSRINRLAVMLAKTAP